MSREARKKIAATQNYLNDDVEMSPEAQAAFDSLVKLMSKQGFGEEGPPRETTFAEIEQFGHRVGRLVGRAIDAELVDRHAEHYAGEEPCPTCDQLRLPKKEPHALPLQTPDGEVSLREPAFRCPACDRDFFPGALDVETRRHFVRSRGAP